MKDADITNLRILDLLGIKKPIENMLKRKIHNQVVEHFLRTVKMNEDGPNKMANCPFNILFITL